MITDQVVNPALSFLHGWSLITLAHSSMPGPLAPDPDVFGDYSEPTEIAWR